MALLEVKDLTLGYENVAIIEGLDFSVNEGDYLCIVGENGSGKTTLMKTLLHLRDPLSGEIIYGDGIQKNEIGYLPQQTIVQRDFPASVKEIVLSGCQGKLGLRPFYNKEEKELAARNMERMGITDLADRCYRELSGGQQQRVLLARALCATGKIILLDDEGITVIMISHDMEAAIRYASHILHIGDDIFFGTKEEYLKSKTGKIYLSYSEEAIQ